MFEAVWIMQRNKELWGNQQTRMRDRKMQCQRLGNFQCFHIASTRFPRGEQSSKQRTQQSTNIQICKFNTSALKVRLLDFRAVDTALYYSVRVARLRKQQSYHTIVLYKIKQLIVSEYLLSKKAHKWGVCTLLWKGEEIIGKNLCLLNTWLQPFTCILLAFVPNAHKKTAKENIHCAYCHNQLKYFSSL